MAQITASTMNGPSFLEEPLLGTIDSQLSEAVSDLDDVSNDELDSITRQKLILDVVYGFGVENHVTTQYYLHGDVAVKGKSTNRSGNSTLQPPRNLKSDVPTADEIYQYFTEDRSEYVTQAINEDTFEWLEDYYSDKEDFPFQDVYLAGLPIYATLHNIRSAIVEQNPNLIPEEPATVVSEQSRKLKRALNRYPIFREIPPYVTEFNSAALPATEWVETATWEGPEDYANHYDFVDYLYKFFYEGVWKAVGQQMSYNTVEGPSAETTRNRRKREIKTQRHEFKHFYNRLEMESDHLETDINIDTERLPDLEVIEHDPNPAISEEEIKEIPRDDPAFSILN